MPHKHIEDRRAYHRRYYQEHKEEINAQWRAWYQKNKHDPAFWKKRAKYAREYRIRKKYGL